MSESVSLERYVADKGHDLVRFAYGVTGGDFHRAEDLVQSALAKVLRRWNEIASAGTPDAYVRKVIVSEELSWRRRRAASEVVSTQSVQGQRAHRGSEPTAAVDDADEIWRTLSCLPARQRAAVVLRYVEDWSYPDIAVAMKCSQETVRSQVSRALATLRNQRDAQQPTTAGRNPK